MMNVEGRKLCGPVLEGCSGPRTMPLPVFFPERSRGGCLAGGRRHPQEPFSVISEFSV
jgi:hypothetical protein